MIIKLTTLFSLILSIITPPTIPYLPNRRPIRKNLEDRKVGCGIFVDLQKTFDTVHHNILQPKIEHDAIGIPNDLIKSYFSDEDNLSLLMDSILTMLGLNMEFLQGSVTWTNPFLNLY